MIDTRTAESPGWWMARLMRKLNDVAPHYDMLDSYVDGTARIPVHTHKEVKKAYRQMMRMAHTNYAEMICEAVRERMMPQGFRTGVNHDLTGDNEALRLWQANSLDADCDLVHRPSLGMGAAYVIVGDVDPDIDAPLITAEDPRQVVVEYEPGRRRKVRAALKVFGDDVAGLDRAYLFLPGQVHKAARKGSPMTAPPLNMNGWEQSDELQTLPAGIGVPVVPFLNRANNFMRPMSEIEGHLGLLDRINFMILNRLEIATLQAFRQRAVQGVPNKDDQGNDIDYEDIFANDPSALWIMPETAKIWESGQVDLGPILNAVRHDVQDLAAVTRTPLYYLTPDAANGSAEGASLAREGLIFKAADRIRAAGESWEQVMCLAFRFAGDEARAKRGDMEVIWAPPERHSLAERSDAAVKAMAAGVPWRTRMSEIMQFSPQTVERMAAERVEDALVEAAAAPPMLALPPGAPQGPPPAPLALPAPTPAPPAPEPAGAR